jgi:hypothetical protein
MKQSAIASRLGREFVTVKEAAILLGVSEQAVHAACRNGRIRFETIASVRVLERDGLADRWHGSSQRRRVVPQSAAPGPDWPAIADHFNRYLGDSWPGAPFSAEQTATIEMCLSLAREAVAGE